MRILVLIHEFPPIGGGGGRVAQDICTGLARRGHEVRVVTAHLPGDGSSPLPERETLDGFEIIRLPSGRKEAFKASLPAMLGYVAASLSYCLRMVAGSPPAWRPDLIHVHFAVPAGAAAWALSRLTGIPYVLTAHLGDVPGGTPEKTGRWFRWIYPFTPPIWQSAARVVAVSAFTRQLARQAYPGAKNPLDIQVIPNGVDLASLSPQSIQVNQPPRIVFAGRFMAQKNPLQVVRVLSELTDLPWRCAMLGDGPLRPDVEAEIERLKLRDRFTLTGWIKPEEVLAWLRQADILFMPSLSEGLPVVGVQALAMGLALVVGRVGGFVDLVEDGQNGYMRDPLDGAGFVQSLRQLLATDEHAQSQSRLLSFRLRSRQLACRFDLDAVVQSYLQIFESLKPTKHA